MGKRIVEPQSLWSTGLSTTRAYERGEQYELWWQSMWGGKWKGEERKEDDRKGGGEKIDSLLFLIRLADTSWTMWPGSSTRWPLLLWLPDCKSNIQQCQQQQQDVHHLLETIWPTPTFDFSKYFQITVHFIRCNTIRHWYVVWLACSYLGRDIPAEGPSQPLGSRYTD